MNSESVFSSMLRASGSADLERLFKEFLSLSILALKREVGKDPVISCSDDLTERIVMFDRNFETENFQSILTTLIREVKQKSKHSEGNDLLGEFYGKFIEHASNYISVFYPFALCEEYVRGLPESLASLENDKPRKVLHRHCGSGRILLASLRHTKSASTYYGIDTDEICVMISAINLFLNAAHNAEILCLDSWEVPEFVLSYRVTSGRIVKNGDKAESEIWKLLQNPNLVPDNKLVG